MHWWATSLKTLHYLLERISIVIAEIGVLWKTDVNQSTWHPREKKIKFCVNWVTRTTYNTQRIWNRWQALCIEARRTSAASCATTMQLAWLDLRTRDTSVCVHLVTRENTAKRQELFCSCALIIILVTTIMRLFCIHFTLVWYASTCLPMTYESYITQLCFVEYK